ncbi:hypothetical protein Varpa_4979 [Variovorax paradoxus EPS]|uniref:Uncharacterized protein n=1 Tax=Variovorax paradoxus (strain EPS) TaxID=595537 RepID=E6V260_VARPE|nr:hypothetical protein Varpa_4979 [Variovorax paradoxus EPS]
MKHARIARFVTPPVSCGGLVPAAWNGAARRGGAAFA